MPKPITIPALLANGWVSLALYPSYEKFASRLPFADLVFFVPTALTPANFVRRSSKKAVLNDRFVLVAGSSLAISPLE